MKVKNMRRILLIGIIAFAGLATSCVREIFTDVNTAGDPAVIELAMSGGTRGLLPTTGILDDGTISSLRIMIFNASTGLVAHNFLLSAGDLSAMKSSNTPYKMTISTGNFDFAFIANEDSDTELRGGTTTLTQILNAYTTSSGHTIASVMAEHFSSSAFQNPLTIPMTAIFRNAKVSINNTITLAGKTSPEAAPWRVEVERAGIRVDLILKTTEAFTVANFTSLQITNVPNKVYLFPTNASNTPLYNVSGSGSFESTSPIPAYRTIAGNDGDIFTTDVNGEYFAESTSAVSFVETSAGSGEYYWYKRIILPSSMFTPAFTEANAIILTATVAGNTSTATLGTGALGYTADRNNRYRVAANLKASEAEMEITTTILEWNNVSLSGGIEGPMRDGVIQAEANSYIIPKGWETPILIPISQVTKGYSQAGVIPPGGLPINNSNYTVSLLWSEMEAGGTKDYGVIAAAGDYILVQAGNREGNFVVQMKNAAGDYLWSWHIWVTNGYYPYVTNSNIPNSNKPDGNPNNHATSNNKNWLLYNLGAFGAVASGTPTAMTSTASVFNLDSRGLYYQWGRKDPFKMLGTVATASITTPALALSNPDKFATNSGSYYGTLQQVSGPTNNSWGNSVTKTAFDPCPPGYKVPVGGSTSWYDGSYSSWNNTTTSFGSTHPSFGGYYPYGGFRTSGGDPGGVGTYGFTWNATNHATTENESYVLSYSTGTSTTTQTSARYSGFSVRCITEVEVEDNLPAGVIQPEANSYIIPVNWNTPILIPISQVIKGYLAAGVPIPGGDPTGTNYSVSVLWLEMETGGTKNHGVVRAKGDYILVQAGDRQGNFVIQMKNEAGVYLWSWHIWVTDGYYPYETTGQIPNSSTPDANPTNNAVSDNKDWMLYNLGAFNAAANGAQTVMANNSTTHDSRGLYYQWGRKDAFPMTGAVNIIASLPSAAEVLSSTEFAVNNIYGTLQASASNDSWGGYSGVKTPFDPCPPGYKVPTEDYFIEIGRASCRERV